MSKTTIRIEKGALRTDMYLKVFDLIEKATLSVVEGVKENTKLTKPVEINIDIVVRHR